ncbi:RecT family recombinase [Curtobacterium sp. NPDC087080]|uniref:RecT family recombinase n=1 Tax=Curtobacterium sp. NPDC087080 TaxID=3363965 RepID=UPI003830AE31
MTTEVTTLPANGDVTTWTPAEKAIADAAGLVFTHTYGDRQGQREPAPRAVVEKFLALSRQSGLNPLSNQIWCIGRLSKGRVEWAVQTGIDGFRLVADRSENYAGQDAAEWMTDSGEWVDAFIPKLHGGHPLAARVRVYRYEWDRPAVGVAEWGAYVQTKRDGTPTEMWAKQGAGQLAKCAEALALRKAFPMDLSGLYTSDEIAAAPEQHIEIAGPSRDWSAEIAAATTHEEVEDLLDAADDAGERTDAVRTAAMTRHGMLGEPTRPDETVVDPEPEAAAEAPAPDVAPASPAGLSDADWLAQAEADVLRQEGRA